MNKNTQLQKKGGLDVLRGIGIVGIVLYHAFPSVFRGGFLGVPLFFVLSGYLMYVTGDAAWEEGNFHIIHYYRKRIARIFPPLFAMVMGVCCYLTLFDRGRLAGIRGEIGSIFLGLDNWWQIRQNSSYFTKLSGASPFIHLWFLAVEIQLYLLWPVIFVLYKKCCKAVGGRKMCFLFLALALLSAARMWFLYIPGEDPSRVYYGTDTMAFPLLLGIFAGAFRQQYADPSHSGRRGMGRAAGNLTPHRHARHALAPFALFGTFVLAICILFITVNGQLGFVYQGGMFGISLLFAALICFLENQGDTVWNALDTSLMALIGRKSYLIYLWHYPVIVLALL